MDPMLLEAGLLSVGSTTDILLHTAEDNHAGNSSRDAGAAQPEAVPPTPSEDLVQDMEAAADLTEIVLPIPPEEAVHDMRAEAPTGQPLYVHEMEATAQKPQNQTGPNHPAITAVPDDVATEKAEDVLPTPQGRGDEMPTCPVRPLGA